MPYTYEITNDPVAVKIQDLLDSGAQPLNPAFSVANADQGEVVFNDRRLLVADNDDTYRRYAHVLKDAEVPYVENNPLLGNNRVIVGEIPRDARALSTIIRSVQPHNGEDVRDVFAILGREVRQIIDRKGVAPSPESVNLDRLLVVRSNLSVLLVPPVDFVPTTEDTSEALTQAIYRQLTPKYERFGSAALLASFQDGLGA